MKKAEAAEGLTSDSRAADEPLPESAMSCTRMAYMADLLLELETMATAEGHKTLAGLLALAHAEAAAKAR